MQEQIITAHDLQFKPYLTEAQILERVEHLGEQLRKQFDGKYPLFIGILNGSFMLTADLVRAANIDCEIAFTKLSSYSGTSSTGEVKTLIGLEADVKGRDVVVVEDIVDTGKTLEQFMATLKAYEPASVTLATLLLKPEPFNNRFPVDLVGFEIPNKFVIGYGLDYDGAGRYLKGIYQLVE